MENERNELRTYFALDTRVIKDLAYIFNNKLHGIKIDIGAIKNKKLSDNFNYLVQLLNLARWDEIRFLVTKTVYEECKGKPHLKNFLEKLCYIYFPKDEELTQNLAKAYFCNYEFDGTSYTAPFDTSINTKLAYAKALKMAEATQAEAACFIVYDNDFYIRNNALNVDFDHSRKKRVQHVNQLCGFSCIQKSPSGEFVRITTTPMQIYRIIPAWVRRVEEDRTFLQTDGSNIVCFIDYMYSINDSERN